MGFQDDWILRQVEMIVQFVSRILFSRDSLAYTADSLPADEDSLSDDISRTDRIYYRLRELIREERLCEAEDFLFDNIEYSDKYIELAVDFYQTINQFNDDELERQDFSRDEIYDGLIEILKKLNVPLPDFSV